MNHRLSNFARGSGWLLIINSVIAKIKSPATRVAAQCLRARGGERVGIAGVTAQISAGKF